MDLFIMVLQDTWLFEGTIKENIVFDKQISNEELSEILSKSKILHMIEGLPNGLSFQINEETNQTTREGVYACGDAVTGAADAAEDIISGDNDNNNSNDSRTDKKDNK